MTRDEQRCEKSESLGRRAPGYPGSVLLKAARLGTIMVHDVFRSPMTVPTPAACGSGRGVYLNTQAQNKVDRRPLWLTFGSQRESPAIERLSQRVALNVRIVSSNRDSKNAQPVRFCVPKTGELHSYTCANTCIAQNPGTLAEFATKALQKPVNGMAAVTGYLAHK